MSSPTVSSAVPLSSTSASLKAIAVIVGPCLRSLPNGQVPEIGCELPNKSANYILDSVAVSEGTNNTSTMSETGHPVCLPHLHNSSVISVRFPTSRSQGPPICTLDELSCQEPNGLTKSDWPKGIYPNGCRVTRYGQGTNLGGMMLQFTTQGFHMSYSAQCIHRLVRGLS